MKLPSLLALFVAGCTLAALTMSAAAKAGDLDFSFGTGNVHPMPGMVVLPEFGTRAILKSLAVQPDGKIVIAGYQETGSDDLGLRLTRLLPDGRVDPQFNSSGLAAPQTQAIAWGVALQADGGILVAGHRKAEGLGGQRGILLRFLPDGTPDTSFPGNAFIMDTFGNPSAAFAVTILNDGKILVAGGTLDYSDQTPGILILARLNANGSPDSTFGNSGKIAIPGPVATRIAVQDDGKIVTVGSNGGFTASVTLTRFDAGGKLDPTFGNGGSLTVFGSPGEGLYPGGVALQSGGKIIVAAYTVTTGHNQDFVLLRFLPDGSPDTSFQDAGKVITDVSALSGPLPNGIESLDGVWDLSVDSGGNLFVAGNSNGWAALVRYLPNGDLDPGFGTGGIVRTRVWEAYTLVEAVALQPDGKILTAGAAIGDPAGGIAVFRYQGKGTFPGMEMTVERDGKVLNSGQTVEMGTAFPFDQAPREAVLTLRNTGSVTLSGITARVLNSGEGPFELTSPPAVTLSRGASSTFTLKFTPVREISSFRGALVIQTDDQAIGMVLNLHGSTELPVATLQLIQSGNVLEPGSNVNLGTFVTGAVSSRQFTLFNSGNIDLTLQGITMADSGNPGDFSIDAPETSVLPPDASTPFTVTFSPRGPGVRTARLRIASTDTFNPPLEIGLTGFIPGFDAWRLNHFGSTLSEGPAADLSDPDQDGIPNLLEYATLTNPNEINGPAGVLVKNGDTLEYTITRPGGAAADLNYTLEWSDELQTGWNSTGVSVSPQDDNGTPQQVKFSVAAGSGKRFVRLRVTRQ